MMANTAPKFSDLHRVAMGTCDDFYKELVNLGVTLPLLVAPDDPCTLIDAEGEAVLVIDHNGVMTNERAIAITLWIMTAINTCGGFKVESA